MNKEVNNVVDMIKINFMEEYHVFPELLLCVIETDNHQYNVRSLHDDSLWFRDNFKSIEDIHEYLNKEEYRKVLNYKDLGR